jgi:hypothetical protein
MIANDNYFRVLVIDSAGDHDFSDSLPQRTV